MIIDSARGKLRTIATDMLNVARKSCLGIALAVVTVAAPVTAYSANVLLVDEHGRLAGGGLQSFFTGLGLDTVTTIGNWNSAPADLSAFDIVWDGGHFSDEGAANATKVINFVNGGGGFYGQTERPCCDAHNGWLQGIFRTLTGDNGLVFGGAGDGNGGTGRFLTPDTTILLDPNDIRNTVFDISAPGQLVNSDPSKVFAKQDGAGGFTIGLAYATQDLVNDHGRLVTISDIDWLNSISEAEHAALVNIRKFLLSGESLPPGCGQLPPGSPGCEPGGGGNAVPEPGTLALVALGLFGLRRLRARVQ